MYSVNAFNRCENICTHYAELQMYMYTLSWIARTCVCLCVRHVLYMYVCCILTITVSFLNL